MSSSRTRSSTASRGTASRGAGDRGRGRTPVTSRTSSGGPDTGRNRRLLAGLGLLAVLGLGAGVVVATTGGDDGASSSPGGGGTAGAVQGIEVAHVHGVGLDPADGTVYAGTHEGLYRIPASGEPELVAERVQDFMGFTVVGPNRFLASGHPGPGQDLPNPVGMLESTDGGQTWETLSLAGQADFHALAASGDVVYGYSGQLLASTDGGRRWEARSATPVASLAVDPRDDETLLATTQQGPARSTDGARSFTPVDGAPELLLLSWPAPDVLFGVTPDGVVHASSDGGATWEERGQLPGPPEALHAAADGTVLAAADGQVLQSRDGGRTFTGPTS